MKWIREFFSSEPMPPMGWRQRVWIALILTFAIVLASCKAATSMPSGHVKVNVDSTFDGAWHTRNADVACRVIVTDKGGLKHYKQGYATFKGKRHAQTVIIYLNHKYQRSVDSNSFCGGWER